MFSTHTALLNGQERKRGFLGTTGHPDTIQADTPGVSIWLSPPYPLLHKELSRTGSHLALQFSKPLAAGTRGSGRVTRAPVPRDETTGALPPCPHPRRQGP